MDVIIKGKVIHGKGNGKKLFVPTFNLEYKNDIKVEKGVFISEVLIDEKKYTGVTNIGKRPTIDNDDKKTIETYILDFDRDIYDKEVTLVIKEKLRDTKKFDDVEQLKKQLLKDIDEVKKRSLNYD